MDTYIIQGIGFVGMTLAVISFQKNTNKGILLFQTLTSAAFATQFILLGAYTGAVMNILGALRNIVFYNRKSKWACKGTFYAIMLLYVVLGIITYQNYFSILSIVGMLLSTIGFWIVNPKYTRRLSLISSPCFLVYNFASSSIAGVLTEVFVISSVLVAMYKFDYKKLGEKNEKDTI